MPRHAPLQIIGPAVLFAMLLVSEAAAYALAVYPSSDLLWSLNLEAFRIFQNSRRVLSAYIDFAHFEIVGIGLPLLFAACYGFAFRCRFALALASSLSFVYMIFLLCTSYVCDESWRVAPSPLTHSMGTALTGIGGILLGASLLSLIVSHMNYLHACRTEGHGGQSVRLRGRPGRDRRRAALCGIQ
jgi:hypothetical protein